MRQTCVVTIAIAITLCVAGVALGQPQPDPAPVPPPSEPTPPAPSSTPAEPTPQASPPARERKRTPERTARREKAAERTYSVPAHVTRAEAVATLTRSNPIVRSQVVTASAVVPATTTGDGFPAAAGAALILLVGSGLLALAFALMPARALGAVSGLLVERRADIGLGLALTLALGAAAFIVLVGT